MACASGPARGTISTSGRRAATSAGVSVRATPVIWTPVPSYSTFQSSGGESVGPVRDTSPPGPTSSAMAAQ